MKIWTNEDLDDNLDEDLDKDLDDDLDEDLDEDLDDDLDDDLDKDLGRRWTGVRTEDTWTELTRIGSISMTGSGRGTGQIGTKGEPTIYR
ncbi:hypothetical protein EJ02DRAFT_428606 [Clathrospora elynae]|uniref:Uncharacterized protein n=1 Tax=Clathrospora elynae TaxID=706981 RepID=A0A6A5SA17_9PLEO|nr:hypothetical protein EJ02DRAFT_428606 [Clathrospora elynae]